MLGKNDGLEALIAPLTELKQCVLLSHVNPDPDALGSICGLGIALRESGVKVRLINQSKVPESLFFIPGASEVSNFVPELGDDWLLVLDCGDVTRFGDDFRSKLEKHPKMINIDHHHSNTNFGTLNWVDAQASSTCEMVYKLLLRAGKKISRESATALLTGVMADTGSFRFRSTSAETFRVAADLIECGAVAQEVADPLFHNRTKASVAFKSFLINQMNYHFDGKLGEVIATKDVISRFNVSDPEMEGVIDEIRSIEGVIVSVFIRKDSEIWRISMRSKSPSVDVSSIAARFGGGGHKAAAAFRSRKELEEFRPLLLAQIGEQLSKIG